MSEPVKFTDEEMKTIQDIQKKYFDIQGELGRISITKIRLNQQLESLDDKEDSTQKDFVSVQEEEKNFIESINKKYGEGVLDPESGTFTPSKK
tara:strand:+ start:536 stop:814 length:279 start_codon:yes stop_codon:yes gene_type:complete